MNQKHLFSKQNSKDQQVLFFFNIFLAKQAEFNPHRHQPPRIDMLGFNKNSENYGAGSPNALTIETRIPSWWSKPGIQDEEKKTRSKLQQQRKLEKLPHLSYDLDGDGYVGNKDFVIAKHFDTTEKGFLTQEEKQKAINACKKEGFEKDFMWNVEVSGGARPYRLLQKRGEIVDAEDFIPVGKTYPDHPDKLIDPNHKTFVDLKAARLESKRQNIADQKKHWEEIHPPAVEMKMPVSEFMVDDPKHNTRSQIIRERHEEARRIVGLPAKEQDIKVTDKDPQLGFNQKPLNASKSALVFARGEETMKQLKSFEKNIGNFKDGKDRLGQREECLMRLGFKETKGRTKGTVQEERMKSDNDHLTSIYGNISVGINGELPKFSHTPSAKEGWWRSTKTWNPNPKNVSALHLSQKQKWWAKDDRMKMADSIDDQGPIDEFKKNYVAKNLKNQVQPKVNETSHWSKTEDFILNQEPLKREALKVRWSEKESMLRCNAETERLFAKLVRQSQQYEDQVYEAAQKRQDSEKKKQAQNVAQKQVAFLGKNIEKKDDRSSFIVPKLGQGDNSTNRNLDMSGRSNGQRLDTWSKMSEDKISKAPLETDMLTQQNTLANISIAQANMSSQALQQYSQQQLAPFGQRSSLISRVKEGNLNIHRKEELETGSETPKPETQKEQQQMQQNKSISTSATELKAPRTLNQTAMSKSSASFFKDSALKGVHSGFGVFGKKSKEA